MPPNADPMISATRSGINWRASRSSPAFAQASLARFHGQRQEPSRELRERSIACPGIRPDSSIIPAMFSRNASSAVSGRRRIPDRPEIRPSQVVSMSRPRHVLTMADDEDSLEHHFLLGRPARSWRAGDSTEAGRSPASLAGHARVTRSARKRPHPARKRPRRQNRKETRAITPCTVDRAQPVLDSCSSAGFGTAAGGAFLASDSLAGVVALGAGRGWAGLAVSSGLHPLTIATHRPMLAASVHALNPQRLSHEVAPLDSSDEQAHPRSE